MSLDTALQPLRTRWSRMPGREKNLVRLAALLVLGLALWLLSVGPSLRTLRTADAQSRTLDAQLQQMLALQAQAQALQQQPPLAFDDAVRALTAATQQTLGASAQMAMAGDRASITLKNASPDTLAQWLAQARVNARAVPLEARLTRAAAAGSPGWSGVLVMGLPAR